MTNNNVKNYNKEFKIKAVLLSFQRNSIAQAAKELEVSKQALYLWRVDYRKYGDESFPGFGIMRLTSEEKIIRNLEKEIDKTRTEFDILYNAGDYLSRGRLYTFNYIAENEKKYSIKLMCRILGQNRGTYRIWKKDFISQTQSARLALREQIKLISAASQQRYGCRRIAAQLQKSGYKVSHTTVLKHMRELGICVSIKKNIHHRLS